MWGKTGIVLLAIASYRAFASAYIQPDFIENVIRKAGDSRIVSGWEAEPGQHPHHASLRMVSMLGWVSACGGSIVHRNWLITAAHCTAGSVTLVVRAGVTNLTTPEYIFETREWYNHPTYNDLLPSVVQPNDISIVRLQRPVVYTQNLRSIRVQSNADAYRNYDSDIIYASGHGRTWTNGNSPEVLNWVYLRGVSNPSCASLFGTIITSTTVCARFFNVTSQSICQGDSGGPLVYVGEDNVPTLIGVSSFVAGGDFGCHSGLPGGFIRPGPFHSWFTDVTGINFDGLEEETTTTSTTTTTTPTTTTTSAPLTTTSASPNTTYAPSTTTSAPLNTTYAPSTTTSSSPNTTYAPSTTTSAPLNTTYAPSTTTSSTPNTTYVPSTTTSASPNTTYAPSTTTSAPLNTTYAPSTTTSSSPNTTYAPSTITPTPLTTTSSTPNTTYAPSTTTSASPNTTYAPSTTTSAPLNTTYAPSTTTSSSPNTTYAPSTTTLTPSTTTSAPNTTETPETEESEEDPDSDSEEDPELSELLKKLEVKVKVKVKLSKNQIKKHEHEHKVKL